MKITIFSIFILIARVVTQDWIEKSSSNAITLVEKLPAYISTETYTIKYNFDLNTLHDSLNKIGTELSDIGSHCTERKTNNCKNLLKKLTLHSDRLQIKLNSLYEMEDSKNENVSDIFDYNRFFRKISNQSVTSENLHYRVENCILDIQNLDNLINAIEIQLESGGIYSFFNIISEKKFESDLTRIHKNLDGEKALPIEANCTYQFEYKKHKENILKTSDISTNLKKSVLLIKIKIPIIHKVKYQLYKVLPIPIRMKHTTMIFQIKQKYMLKTCNNSLFDVSNENVEEAKILLDNSLIITVTSPKDLESCEIAMILEYFSEKHLKNCQFKFIPNVNYLVKIQRNMYHAHIVENVSILKKCPNSKSKIINTNKEGILNVPLHCTLEILGKTIESDTGNSKQKNVISTQFDMAAIIGTFYEHKYSINFRELVYESKLLIINKMLTFELLAEETHKQIENQILKTEIHNRLEEIEISTEMNEEFEKFKSEMYTTILYGFIILTLVSFGFTIMSIYVIFKIIFRTENLVKVTARIIKKLESERKTETNKK